MGYRPQELARSGIFEAYDTGTVFGIWGSCIGVEAPTVRKVVAMKVYAQSRITIKARYGTSFDAFPGLADNCSVSRCPGTVFVVDGQWGKIPGSLSVRAPSSNMLPQQRTPKNRARKSEPEILGRLL